MEGVPAPLPETDALRASVVQLPLYWTLLSDPDKAAYLAMRQALSSSACKHRRNHSKEINQDIVTTIRSFVMRNDADDWKRGLVCGICWLSANIAINTRQLRLLLSKCKSSINAMFQAIGYATVPTTNDYAGALASLFPVIKDNFGELRKWTIRSAKVGDVTIQIPRTDEIPGVQADGGA
jgi:hypothetical protein